MKTTLIILVFALLSIRATSQITKGNWLVGGNGRFARQQETLLGSEVNSIMIQVSPNLGYFFVDKFAAGLKPSFGFTRFNTNGSINKSTTLGVGPFIRYYFLPIDNRTNLFTEGDYQYLSDFNGYSQNTFILSAGPVIYFNSVVGIEITMNYELIHSTGSATSAKTFFLGIGFQIHLESEKVSNNY
jgi:hypothetical protein